MRGFLVERRREYRCSDSFNEGKLAGIQKMLSRCGYSVGEENRNSRDLGVIY